jgi:hypothetical protein
VYAWSGIGSALAWPRAQHTQHARAHTWGTAEWSTQLLHEQEEVLRVAGMRGDVSHHQRVSSWQAPAFHLAAQRFKFRLPGDKHDTVD